MPGRINSANDAVDSGHDSDGGVTGKSGPTSTPLLVGSDKGVTLSYARVVKFKIHDTHVWDLFECARFSVGYDFGFSHGLYFARQYVLTLLKHMLKFRPSSISCRHF